MLCRYTWEFYGDRAHLIRTRQRRGASSGMSKRSPGGCRRSGGAPQKRYQESNKVKTWGPLAWGIAIASGPLLFLRLVANRIAQTTRRLDFLAEQKRIAARRHAEMEAIAKAHLNAEAA